MVLKGLYTALVTPFTTENKLDEAALRALVDIQVQAGVDGLVPVGTTGESPTLSAAEQVQVIKTVVEHCQHAVTVIAGCGSNSTAKAIEATKRAVDVGIDATLHVAPYYNKPNQDGLLQHYLSIAEAVQIPMVVYNIPGRCGVNIHAQTILKLFQHPNIIAVKEANKDMDHILHVLRDIPHNRSMLSGNDDLTASIMNAGGAGLISVTANLFPNEMLTLVRAAQQSKFADAYRLHNRLLPIFDALFSDTNPIPIKYALAERGLIAERYRLPLCAPSPAVKRAVQEAIAAFQA